MLYTNGNNQFISAPKIRTQQLLPPTIQHTKQGEPTRTNRNGQIRILPSTTVIQPPKIPYKEQMKWGEPTWTLFHVLAEKIRPEYFHQIRFDLLNIITSICANLQCPDCANHATTYMNTINLNLIQTKEHLRTMLHSFHNSVNARKNVPQFVPESLDIYKNMPLIQVLHRFMYYFELKYTTNMRMIPNGFARTLQAKKLKEWFNLNFGAFE
jgi:hypothetical protein